MLFLIKFNLRIGGIMGDNKICLIIDPPEYEKVDNLRNMFRKGFGKTPSAAVIGRAAISFFHDRMATRSQIELDTIAKQIMNYEDARR